MTQYNIIAKQQIHLFNTIFENYTINYKIINDELWIKATDLADPLCKHRHTLLQNIKDLPNEMRCQVEHDTGSNIQNVIFLSKQGALMEIMQTRCKKDSMIYNFKLWAVRKLDELLTEGRTELVRQKNNKFAEKLTSLKAYMIEKPVEDKVKIWTKSHIKNSIELMQKRVDENSTMVPMTIMTRLQEKFNLNNMKEIVSLAIKIGRIASKEYIIKYGKKPEKIRQIVYGTNITNNVAVYSQECYEEWLDDLIRNYL